MKETDLQQIITENGLRVEHKGALPFLVVKDAGEGITVAKNLLEKIVDSQTVLFLSGGRTPKEMYTELAFNGTLKPGAVALVDERYGEPFHATSNELMIRDTGFLDYLNRKNIRFFPILKEGLSREQIAEEYDGTVRLLLNQFRNSVGILGIGLDGHTAGIAGNRANFHNPLFDAEHKNEWVGSFDDQTGMFKERVTMTFPALSALSSEIVLVFGEDKKNALEKMLESGSPAGGEQEIPARFFTRADIAEKTLVITDQKI